MAIILSNPRRKRNPRFGSSGDVTFSRGEQKTLLAAHTADIILWGGLGYVIGRWMKSDSSK